MRRNTATLVIFRTHSNSFPPNLDLFLLRLLEPLGSTELNVNTSFDPQLQSKFFALPAELRLAIYAYFIPDQLHIFPHEERSFRFSGCVQQEEDEDPDCRSQRSNDLEIWKYPASDPICGRRLRSSWGPHWRCEESAMQMGEAYEKGHDATMMSLFLVCKRM